MDKEYLKKYYLKHKEDIKKRSNLRYYRYRTQILKQMKQYVKLNKLQKKQYKHEYWLKNKVRLQIINKKWKQVNRKQLNKQTRIYNKNRKKIDINFKIRCYLASRIYKSLKGYSKSAKTIELLGCSLDLLRLHLQSKFQPGMSFSNYGKWHIDHIIPCARFNLRKSSEQIKCFNWQNLQPLWAKDNISKGDR